TAPAIVPAAAAGSSVPSSAIAGNVVMIAIGTTNVNTSRPAPGNTCTGQRAVSNTALSRHIRLSRRTTQNDAAAQAIQSEYIAIAPAANSTSPIATSLPDGGCPRWTSAHTARATPAARSNSFHGS